MIDWIINLDHLAVREWVNGLWFAVSFAMCFEFGVRLIRRIYAFGHSWRGDIGTRAVLALFAYFVGETLMRGWIWLLLALQNNDNPWVTKVEEGYYIAFVAALMSTWGALCCLYVFSQNHWAWARAAIIVIMFVAIEMLLL